MAATSFTLRRIAVSAFGPSLLFGVGEGAILPIIALSARDLGASVPVAALIVTLIGIGSLISNIPASLITMHRGERWALVAAAVWCALAMALCAWTSHLGVFALGSVMIGMSQAVFSLARQSYLTEAVPMEYRARAMSTLGGAMRIGMFLGPFIAAAAIHRYGLSGAYGVGIAALALAAIVAARIPDLETTFAKSDAGTAGPAPASPRLRSILRDHRRVFATLGVGVLLVSAVRASRQAVIPLWADHLALEASTASLIYGLAAAIDMLVFYPAGKVMDMKGRRWVAVPCMLVMGIGLLLTPLSHGASTLLIAAMVIGFGNGIGSGLVMTLGADHSPRVGRAHFLGLWRLLTDLGTACGPALLSFLAASLSLGAGIAATGVIAFAAAVQLAWWIPPAPQFVLSRRSGGRRVALSEEVRRATQGRSRAWDPFGRREGRPSLATSFSAIFARCGRRAGSRCGLAALGRERCIASSGQRARASRVRDPACPSQAAQPRRRPPRVRG